MRQFYSDLFLSSLKTVRAGLVFSRTYMAWILGQDFNRKFVLEISKEMRFTRQYKTKSDSFLRTCTVFRQRRIFSFDEVD